MALIRQREESAKSAIQTYKFSIMAIASTLLLIGINFELGIVKLYQGGKL